jgi:hypothetical protein
MYRNIYIQHQAFGAAFYGLDTHLGFTSTPLSTTNGACKSHTFTTLQPYYAATYIQRTKDSSGYETRTGIHMAAARAESRLEADGEEVQDRRVDNSVE